MKTRIALLAMGAAAAFGAARTPVILDTDIGTDIDDAFAVALALASPEIELRGITTVSADAYGRALVVCRMLERLGHGNIPVAAGRPRRPAPETKGQYRYGQAADFKKRPEPEPAHEFIYRKLKAEPGAITLVTIGDLTNAARVLAGYPDAKKLLKRIVLMGGAVRVGYQGKPPVEWEWNIRSDIKGAQTVFTSGVPVVMAPLDATLVRLEGAMRERIFQSGNPLGRELHALYTLWGKQTPVLFDPVALALAFNESFVTMEDLRIAVDDGGFTREMPGTPNARVATSIRKDEFLRWYVGRIAARDLWALANAKRHIHRFSTLFTAQDVRDRLSSDESIDEAMAWCRKTGITKVYIESFRDGYQAERAALVQARKRFTGAGFDVSGCVTTTGVGKRSTGWRPLSCYTDKATQERIRSIFEFAAGVFDEIMIDDFWFTDCTCPECEKARAARQVVVDGEAFPVASDSWNDYRNELFLEMSRRLAMGAAKKVNPKARLILKYPQWYDRFHERGYDVARQTALFDRIWVGTETRDRDKNGAMPYEAYFIMRWLGGIGGAKTGGGWYDPLSTTERTYLEQARQTVLAGARESLLFCYRALLRETGPANVEALRAHIPELFDVAEQVGKRRALGIAAYKPPNSPAGGERLIFDYVGMLGLPLAPCHEFPEDAPAAFFSVHALKDAAFARKFAAFAASGKPVLITDGLAAELGGTLPANVRVLKAGGKPVSLLAMPQTELDGLRAHLLRPFGVSMRAPAEVGVYLFEDGSSVIENFSNEDLAVEFNGDPVPVAARGWRPRWK